MKIITEMFAYYERSDQAPEDSRFLAKLVTDRLFREDPIPVVGMTIALPFPRTKHGLIPSGHIVALTYEPVMDRLYVELSAADLTLIPGDQVEMIGAICREGGDWALEETFPFVEAENSKREERPPMWARYQDVSRRISHEEEEEEDVTEMIVDDRSTCNGINIMINAQAVHLNAHGKAKTNG